VTRLTKAFTGLAILLVAISAAPAQSPVPEHVPGRLLVQPVDHAPQWVIDRLLGLFGGKVHHQIDGINVSVVDLPEPAIEHAIDALMKSGGFSFIERDFIAHTSATPNDPDFASQWHLAKIQAISAWGLTQGSASVPIAIIDSGADPNQPDLKPKLLPGWSFLTGTSNTSDTGCNTGHGTAVSGAAAAATNNLTGVAGVGWANPIMPLVVTSAGCFAYYSDMASAINYAVDHGVRIINISITGSTASSTLQSAVDYAWSKGAVIFAAAGNSGSSSPMYPAACNHVLAISATEPTDTLASFSNYGSWVDLSAPGDIILTTQVGGTYGNWWGTSLASPIAAGVGALALSANPSLTNAQLVTLLETNSDDLGTPGFDPYYGYGRVNAYKAVLAAKSMISSADTTPPAVSIGAPSSGATVAGTVSVQGTATDNIGVTKIELDVDGAAVATATSSPFSFSWNSTTVSNSSHSITVKAYDAANNMGSAMATINVSNATIDTTPPVVSITAPSPSTSVSGTISVQGSASDNVGVTKVELDVDGLAVATSTSSAFSFSWNSASKTNGSHTLTVKAFDATNDVGSASMTVSVNNPVLVQTVDSTPPVVAITSPALGSTVSRNVSIAVSATDNVGVTRVAIYVDNVQLCGDTSAPYTCSWNTRKVSVGNHTITATGWDAAGNAGKASSVVTVTK
jgi:thermitase